MQKQEYAKLGAYGQTTVLGPPEPGFAARSISPMP